MASPRQARSAPAVQTISGTGRETLHPQSSTRILSAASSVQISADKRQSISQSSRCRYPSSKQTASPSPRRLASHPLSVPPSASSAHPAGYPQTADPPPATCTIRPDDRPDTSYQSAGAGKAPDAPDRSRNYQTLRRPRSPAPQTKVSHPRANINCVSSPRAAATHRIAPTCRCRSETATPLSPAAFLYSSASTQTTAPRFSVENTTPCRFPTESLPANRLFRPPSRRDSTAPPPDSSNDPDRLSPSTRKFSSDRKNLPGPTSPPRSSSAPSASSANTASPALSRTHRNSGAPQNRSMSAASHEYISHWHSKEAPAARTSRTYRSGRTEI